MDNFRAMRRTKQQLDSGACVKLLRTERRGVLAVLGDMDYPYALPVNFWFDEAESAVYIHCATSGHKIDSLERNDKVCFTVWDEGIQEEGSWGRYVNSVVIFGRGEIVREKVRIIEKIRQLGLKYYILPEEREVVEREIETHIDHVWMICIHIDHMTGKQVYEK